MAEEYDPAIVLLEEAAEQQEALLRMQGTLRRIDLRARG